MKHYVLGFLFSDDAKQVLLLRKTRPVYQAGKLNGVGGHVEPGEHPDVAMHRESNEEIGVAPIWTRFMTYYGNTYAMDCYLACDSECLIEAYGASDEGEPEIVSAHDLPNDTMPNVHHLVPLALDKLLRIRLVDAPRR